MQNIHVLTKFPIGLLSICKDFYKNYDKSLITAMISPTHYAIGLPDDFLKQVNAFLPIPLNRIDLYKIFPCSDIMIPHIDRGRKTALQIPIDIDIDNSYTFAAKYEDLKMLTPKNHQYDTPDDIVVNVPGFYEWDNALYDKYNLSEPIIQNVSMPHGGANFANTDRIFMSGNYLHYEYKYVVEAFKDFY